MKFLVDACLPRGTADVLTANGHVSLDVRDLRMGTAADPHVAAYAQQQGFCLLTEDWGFADVRAYPPAQYHGILVFHTQGMSRDHKLRVMEGFFSQDALVRNLPGRLAIVSENRVRFRPPA
jgi:predicted nuclease of predicted toxin-antitoxin system